MNFDEKSGEIRSYTKWGSWHQTMDTVYVLVDVPRGTRGRDVRCEISANVLKLTVQGQEFISVSHSCKICHWSRKIADSKTPQAIM